MKGVEKTFGGVYALRGAEMRLETGKVHGLIGQNGSGKSTLLSILSGQLRPDGGSIHIEGKVVQFARPDVALSHGIAMVTQELSLADELTVGENIFLGHRKPRGVFGIKWDQLHREAASVLRQLEVDIDPRTPVGKLRIDQQQLVEVARAMSSAAKIVILDEPTSSLADAAVEGLLQMVRRLAASGVGVVFVSHRMDELFEISDQITVLRDGRTVASRPVGDYGRETLVEDMLGRKPEKFVPHEVHYARDDRVLVVSELEVPGEIDPTSFCVYEKEILGVVGLTGSGRSELLQALFGTRGNGSARIEVSGQQSRLPRSPREAMKLGFGFVPGDRKTEGLILELSVRDNVAMSSTALTPRALPVQQTKERAGARRAVAQMKIVAGSIDAPVLSLSGGNQQKVLLSKWMSTDPQLLMLDEPTRGVDVAAKAEIHALLRAARDRGISMLVSSSELEELQVLCDRFLIMYRGRVVAELTRSEATESRLAHLMSGGSSVID